MIDALLYAVRDGIRAYSINYDQATCELMDDGRPPPRAGNVFVAIHGGTARSDRDNQLYELYGFSVTLTMRVGIPLDRVGDQLMSRNIERVPLGYRQGFYAKLEQLRAYLHMNWQITVKQSQTPNSANDNLAAWLTGTVYGFVEPMRYRGLEAPPRLVGAEWFGADPGESDQEIGMVATLKFDGAKRVQPITAAQGSFV